MPPTATTVSVLSSWPFYAFEPGVGEFGFKGGSVSSRSRRNYEEESENDPMLMASMASHDLHDNNESYGGE